MKSRWIGAAEAVGDQILAAAVADGDGLRWPQPLPPGRQQMIEERPSDLWGGGAGIALFLLELYRITRQDRYLQAAQRAIDWCIQEMPNLPAQRKAAFMNGGLSTAYVLSRAYDILGDEALINEALDLTNHLLDVQKAWYTFDLLAGLAGGLLAVAHVEARMPESDLTRRRTDLLLMLLRGGRPHATGLFWDASHRWALPLCGMAHGPSGVAFVLGQFLGPTPDPQHPLRAVIAEALAYEDQYFDADRGNWPDHRGATSARAPREFMNGWCHGAAGIGMARLGLAAGDVPRTDHYHAIAVATTQRDIHEALGGGAPTRSLTLCHGLAGLADFLLLDGSPESLQTAERVGEAAVEQLQRSGKLLPGYASSGEPNHSLFVGAAGVGHFLLRLADPDGVPSVLRPELPETAVRPADVETVWAALEMGLFGRTRRMIAVALGRGMRGDEPAAESPGSVGIPRKSGEGGVHELESLVPRVERRIGGRLRWLDDREAEWVQDVFQLERAHIRLGRAVEDYAELSRGWKVTDSHHQVSEVEGNGLLQLRPGVSTHRTRWDWTSDAGSTPLMPPDPSDVVEVLIVVGLRGTSEQRVSPLTARLLDFLRTPAPLASVLAHFDLGVRSRVRAIVSAGVATGLLFPASEEGATPSLPQQGAL